MTGSPPTKLIATMQRLNRTSMPRPPVKMPVDPVTIQPPGWLQQAGNAVTLVIALLSLGGTLYGWGWRSSKQTKTLDGYGERLDLVEKEQERAKEAQTQWLISLERMIEVNRQLVERVGESRAMAHSAEMTVEAYMKEVRSLIADLDSTLHATDISNERRMSSMETELRLMRENRA